MIRLQKFLADCGVCSRRKAEELILDKKIKVNNKVISELGFKIDIEKDTIFYDGKKLNMPNKKIYIIFNKPTGCVTTAKEQFNRKTVFDYIDIKERIFPIGRLDYDTSGLLILTNDGDLTYKLTHPKHNIKKVYIAKVMGIPSKEKMKNFENGLIIDEYKTAPASIKIISKENNKSTLEISIFEGRNRQVRKMCEKIGHRVISLKRIAIEDLKLSNLEIGKFRYLNKNEIDYLKKLTKN